MCKSGKTAYFTRSKAKSVCRTIKSEGKGNMDYRKCNVKLMPYHCRLCGMWHVTSQGKIIDNSIAKGHD